MAVRAVFFDAGNTLVFADRTKTLAPLAARGISVTEVQIHSAERTARRHRDAAVMAHREDPDVQYWQVYYRELLGTPADDVLLSELVTAARTSGNWTVTPANARAILTSLRRRYRLAVISNSDGNIAKLFVHLGLGDLFESITDSGVVGVQKPHPEIFRAALRSVCVPAEESVYVGDVYSIDYLGAQSVGMKAVLFDPYGTYASNGIPRVTRLEDLEPLLASSL